MLRAWRPSVCLFVTLVDCDQTVQQIVETGTWQDRLVSWLPASRNRPESILNSTEEDQWGMEECGACTWEPWVQRLACRGISASAELLLKHGTAGYRQLESIKCHTLKIKHCKVINAHCLINWPVGLVRPCRTTRSILSVTGYVASARCLS